MSTPAPVASATVADLRAQVQPRVDQLPAVRAGFDNLQGFELAQRAAKLLAASSLVPQQFQGNIANCTIALEMAQRIGASPLMVMQHLYIVHGRPAWSATFMIAAFNQCGRFSSIRYEWVGTEGKDDWGCRAWAIEKATGEKITGPLITIGLAKNEGWYAKQGSKWKTIPQLMLMYRAAAWLVRTHAPEISMGLQTTEELQDIYDAERGEDGTYQVTTDSLRQAATIDQTPQVKPIDDATAIQMLKDADTIGALEAAWSAIVENYQVTGREIPRELDAAMNDRRAAIEQKL
jgi:hypothetical protein